MQLNKIRVSDEASERLKQLKGRTGLTPNILSRLGFCLSLGESGVPDPSQYGEGEREFNRYTLLGEWDEIYVALLKQRMNNDGLPVDNLEDQFRAHLNRGVIAMSKLVKSVSDIARLTQRAEG